MASVARTNAGDRPSTSALIAPCDFEAAILAPGHRLRGVLPVPADLVGTAAIRSNSIAVLLPDLVAEGRGRRPAGLGCCRAEPVPIGRARAVAPGKAR